MGRMLTRIKGKISTTYGREDIETFQNRQSGSCDDLVMIHCIYNVGIVFNENL